MDATTVGLLGIVALLVLIFMGMNIGMALMAVGFFGFAIITNFKAAILVYCPLYPGGQLQHDRRTFVYPDGQLCLPGQTVVGLVRLYQEMALPCAGQLGLRYYRRLRRLWRHLWFHTRDLRYHGGSLFARNA